MMRYLRLRGGQKQCTGGMAVQTKPPVFLFVFCLEVKLACLAPALFFSIMLNSSWGKWHRRTHLTNPDDQACVCTCNYGHANNIEQPRSSMSCSAM